jgi:hypothetical protein
MPVYMIRAGEDGPMKIGKANDPVARCRELQTASHQRLFLMRTLDGASQVEQWLHGKFADRRIMGEWFSYCPDMLVIQPPHFDEMKPSARRRPGALADYLFSKRIKLHEFANKIGQTASSVSRLASGVNKPTLDTIQLIYEASDHEVTAEDFRQQHNEAL